MAKYEIMLILDPKEDLKVAETIVNETLKGAQITKLDRTELAYEINKSKSATYVVVEVEANGTEVKEFIRRANIAKSIWRHLVVNLDSENGREESAKKLTAHAEKMKEFAERREAERAERGDRGERPSYGDRPRFSKKEDK